MPGEIEYFYSTRSIYAYLGATRIIDLARRHGRRLVHRPVDLSKVVPAFGGVPFQERPKVHQAYFFGREIERWSEYLGIPALVDPVHHYGDRALSSGLVLAAQAVGVDADALHHAILEALWRYDRDVADADVLFDLARGVGIADAAALLAAARAEDMQAAFEACTARAIALGVPGSPTYIVDGEMFYGQDRLMMVERHLERPFAATP
ncbi:MAG: 2-hydroxychromene-2-carboxylate isomerase [Rhodospirillales bacterium]|nr:MAG: 2-hydroxychromene-2-carboxylate isomerase [Rhodospirillales bacterium]